MSACIQRQAMKRAQIKRRGKRMKSVRKRLWPEFSKLIRKRDGRCLVADDHRFVCGGSLQASHIYPKGQYPLLELFPLNVKTLCWRHHIGWWHKNPSEASAWAHRYFPQEWWDRLETARINSLSRKGWTAEQHRAEWTAYGL